MPTGKIGDAATFGVCIKVTGNWTGKLKEQLCGVNSDDNGVQLKRVAEDIIIRVNDNEDGKSKNHEFGEEGALPVIRIDGPYGSPNEVDFSFQRYLQFAFANRSDKNNSSNFYFILL